MNYYDVQLSYYEMFQGIACLTIRYIRIRAANIHRARFRAYRVVRRISLTGIDTIIHDIYRIA